MQRAFVVWFAPAFLFAIALARGAEKNIPAREDRAPRFEALMRSARAAFLAGRYADADVQYKQLIEEQEAAGVHDVRLARSLYELGAVRKLEVRCDEGADLVARGLQMLEAQGHSDPTELANVWQTLAGARACGRSYLQVEYAYRKALEIERRNPAPRTKVLFDLQADLGSVYQMRPGWPRLRLLSRPRGTSKTTPRRT